MSARGLRRARGVSEMCPRDVRGVSEGSELCPRFNKICSSEEQSLVASKEEYMFQNEFQFEPERSASSDSESLRFASAALCVCYFHPAFLQTCKSIS